MAETTMTNMINPQVMGDMINAKIEALAKITPYAKVDTTLQGVPGDTKTVPSWNYIGDAEDVAEGAEVGLTTLTASTATFTIKKAMKAVGLTQEAINSGLGNPVGQTEAQLAKSIIGKVDNDVLEAALTSTNIVDTKAVIGYAGIVDANTKFEDEEDGVERLCSFTRSRKQRFLRMRTSFPPISSRAAWL
jgi:N4-gp56 family major capsid protein